jgi:hypothetical protein
MGSTKSLTEISARNLHGGYARPVRKADILTTIREHFVYKMWEPRRLTTVWTSTACYRDSFAFLYNQYPILSPCARNSARLKPSLLNITHKWSILNWFLYQSYCTSNIHIKCITILPE